MELTAFVDSVYLPSRIRVSDGYSRALRVAVRRLAEYAGRLLDTAEFSEPLLCGFLSARAAIVGPVTVNNERRQLLTIWQAAYDEEATERPPRVKRIRKLREPQSEPQAWTSDEVARLIAGASKLKGEIAGVPRAAWVQSFLATIYCTGCRVGAMTATPVAAYRPGEGITITEPKTLKARFFALPHWCCVLIERSIAPRELLWPWPYHRNVLFVRMRKLVEATGIPSPHTGRQLFYRLRRTTLSYCARVDIHLAQQQAGHESERTTRRYIDTTIAQPSASAATVLPEIEIG